MNGHAVDLSSFVLPFSVDGRSHLGNLGQGVCGMKVRRLDPPCSSEAAREAAPKAAGLRDHYRDIPKCHRPPDRSSAMSVREAEDFEALRVCVG